MGRQAGKLTVEEGPRGHPNREVGKASQSRRHLALGRRESVASQGPRGQQAGSRVCSPHILSQGPALSPRPATVHTEYQPWQPLLPELFLHPIPL